MQIAIIGAGLAGLTAAYELRDCGHSVDVYEATDRIGGKLHTVAFEAGPTDMGAEAFLARRTDAVEFISELGLGASLLEPSGMGSLIFSAGLTHALPQGGVMGIPASSGPVAHLVSAKTAARIDSEAMREGFVWEAGHDQNLGQLVRERYGDDVVDRIVSSLLGGVYSATADDLGVRATVPELAHEFDRLAADGSRIHLSTAVHNIETSRGEKSAAQGAVFNAFRNGYAELYETLAEKSGADIYVDAFISALVSQGQGLKLKGGEDKLYDRVILAVPAPTAALLLKNVAPEASMALSKVKLANSVVVGMRFASSKGLPLNSGVLVAADEVGVNAKAFTFSSQKWPHLAQRGGALVRASFGRFGDDVAVRADEDDLVDWALDDLEVITGFDGRAAGLEEIYVQRWFGSLPRFDETHLHTVSQTVDILKSTPSAAGISVTGAWVGGVGVPHVIAHARHTVRTLDA